MNSFQIEQIYLDEKAEKDPVSQTILKALPNIPIETVRDKKALIKQFFSMPDSIGIGKNISSSPIFMEGLEALSRDFQSHLLWVLCDQCHHELPDGLLLLCPPGIPQQPLPHPLHQLG